MNTSHEYGVFRCHLCGSSVFVPIGDSEGSGSIELTCSKGHTDCYDRSKLEHPALKVSPSAELKHVAASTS